MSKMTKSELRDILETFRLPIRCDADGDYVIRLPRDEDVGHDVFIFFDLNQDGDILTILSASELKVSDERKGLVFCNKWNAENRCGTAYFDPAGPRIHFDLFEPAHVSRDCLRDDFIKFSMSRCWQFYKEACKEFE